MQYRSSPALNAKRANSEVKERKETASLQIVMLRKYDVQLFPVADARAQAWVGPGLATPLPVIAPVCIEADIF